MVRIDTVVTRGGDGGETSFGDGARGGEDTPRIVAAGAADEAAVNPIMQLYRNDILLQTGLTR